MLHLFSIFCLLKLYAVQPTIGSWILVGLNTYIIHSVTVDPNNFNVVYVGTGNNGIFKSTDGGSIWNAINNGIPNPSLGSIMDIVIDPTNSNVVYAGGGGFGAPGIFKSIDGGTTWAFANTGITDVGFGGAPANVDSMVMDPNNPNNLYSAIGVNCGSVYKTVDGAATWTRGIGLPCDPTVVRIDPSNSSVLYTRSAQGINKSVDSGITWSNISGFGANSVFYALTIDPFGSTKLYADTNTGVYASTDSGVNWVLSESTLTNVYKGLIADPVRANTVYAGEDRGVETSAFMTTTAGSTWTNITDGLPNVGVKRLLVPANDFNALYAGTDAGLYVYGLQPFNPPPVTATFNSAGDTYLKSGEPNRNEGAGIFMRIRASGNNRSLVRFDQSALQSTIGSHQILSAKLRLTITDNGNNWGTTGRTVDVHRLLSDWAEGNGTESNRGTGPGATWNCATDSNIANQNDDCTGSTAWNMNNSSLWPFVSAATATTTITSNQSGTVEFDMTSDVQSFMSGSSQNYGWLVKKTNEGQSGQVSFGTKENTAVPQLVVIYQP